MIKDEDWVSMRWHAKWNNVFYTISIEHGFGSYHLTIDFVYDKSFNSLQEAKDYVNQLIKKREIK
jgi:hypothetical protein